MTSCRYFLRVQSSRKNQHAKKCVFGTRFQLLVASKCLSSTAWITFETVLTSVGSKSTERQSLMFLGPDTQRLRTSNKSMFTQYYALALCGLLLLFCISSRAARYGVQNRSLKLATSQSFLPSEEARLEAAIAALLLLGCVAILRVPRFLPRAHAAVVIPATLAPKTEVIDRESHLRPPPVA